MRMKISLIKKILLVTVLILSLFIGLNKFVLADDDFDSSDSFDAPPDTNQSSEINQAAPTNMDGYYKNQPVSDEDFRNAMQVVKNLNSNKKQRKKNLKDRNEFKQHMKNSEQIAPPPPLATNLLLRLPVNVYISGEVIENGFYLVSDCKQDGQYYLKLNKSGKTIAFIEAQMAEEKACEQKLETKVINNNVVIQYQSGKVIIESALPIVE